MHARLARTEVDTMKTRWVAIGLAVSVGLSVGVAAFAADEKDGGDLKKLEGKWTTPSGQGGQVTYSFKGDKLKIETPSRTYEMTVKLDATAKPDKTIDFKIDEGPDDAKGKTSKGIYKWDGDDKFIFCFRPEGDRPDKYEQNGYEQIVTELKRAK
jgi:uncharacterized protein (TIGR03067 family)